MLDISYYISLCYTILYIFTIAKTRAMTIILLTSTFVLQFFNNMKYIIGGELYSLQDIENGVLRANRKGVGTIYYSQ